MLKFPQESLACKLKRIIFERQNSQQLLLLHFKALKVTDELVVSHSVQILNRIEPLWLYVPDSRQSAQPSTEHSFFSQHLERRKEEKVKGKSKGKALRKGMKKEGIREKEKSKINRTGKTFSVSQLFTIIMKCQRQLNL